jgi:hypothetical protein
MNKTRISRHSVPHFSRTVSWDDLERTPAYIPVRLSRIEQLESVSIAKKI